MKKLGHIAYKSVKGKGPTVVFMSGFRSDMEGSKAVFLEGVCKKLGLGYVRFDYSGHGKSCGSFEDCTIGTWKADALKVIDELTTGKIILVGSSMGGWVALLAALKRKSRIKAIIGIAAAPDFTEDLIWQQLDEFSKHKMLRDGVLMMPNCYDDKKPYPITLKLIEEGRKHLLLRKPINLTCPMRFLHGMADEDVPYKTSAKIAELVKSKDVKVHLLKKSGHRMSEPKELELLKQSLLELI
jgi:pimeloyl-ACP methyl ester carboxylesterase